MTRIEYEPEAYRLRVEGHAGFGVTGADPVCAGVSVLCFTLINAAEDFGLHLYINEQEAVIELRCCPDKEQEERCRFLFDTITSGLEMLAESYPDNVQMKGEHDGEHG